MVLARLPQEEPLVGLRQRRSGIGFEQSWDEHSLAPNVVGYGRPPLEECYRLLRDIRSRGDVQDVLVAIHESPYAEDEEDFDIWPDSDTVYVLTSASEEEVAEWSAPLKATEIGNDWSCNTGKRPAAAPDPTHGMKVFTLWWD